MRDRLVRSLVRLSVLGGTLEALRKSRPRVTEPAASADLLQATLAHAETQLLAQIADETSIDGRTMGIVAFNGALLATDIAAKDVLGPLWWTPLVVVAISTLSCLRSVITKETDLGPLAITFYATYGGLPAQESRAQLLADLGSAFNVNAKRVRAKRNRLRTALISLVVGLIVASVMISLDRPTTMPISNAQGITKTSSTPASGAH